MKFFDYRILDDACWNEITKAVNEVLESGDFINGFQVKLFEKEMADYCNVKSAISVNSGTDALYLSLKALGIGRGDQVITTPFTFVATASAILNVGAKPVFVDIKDDFNINPDLIKDKLSMKTKAIIPVHLFGLKADMNAIMKIADRFKLLVIEDSAQSLGAEREKAGLMGNIGCLSFYPTKNLGCYGDGGMTLTNDLGVATKIQYLKNHGINSSMPYLSIMAGQNSRLDEIQATILRVKLKYLETSLLFRQKMASRYCEKLNLSFNPNSTYNQFVIRIRDRDEHTFNFPTKVYYSIPLHLQPAFRKLKYKEGDFPKAEKAAKEVLALPIIVSELNQDLIIKELQKCQNLIMR